MSDVKHTFERIIELSKQLHDCDKYWYCNVNEPSSRSDIIKKQMSTELLFPDDYITCMTVSNGFTVDFSSTTGYFHLYPVRNVNKNGKYSCFGWLSHRCLYFNPDTGEMFIEKQRYKYTPIMDFNAEILVPAEKYLSRQLELSKRRHELLDKQKDNPLRKYYDKFLEYREMGVHITLYPPASEEEICRWEADNVKLPESFRNWLLLTNGSIMDYQNYYSLDRIFRDKVCWSENEEENREFYYLATVDGCGTTILLDPENGVMSEFDHDHKDPWTVIDDLSDYFEEEFEWIEENDID